LHLLGRAGGGDARGCETGAADRQGDPGAAPVELFGGDHLHLALRIRGVALDRLEAAEALLPRLFDRLPGDALLFVVLARDRPDHLAGELPAPRFELLLVLVKCETHPLPLSAAYRLTGQSASSGTLLLPGEAHGTFPR